MNRKIGFDNRLCYQREVARCQKIHQDKLRHMQPTSLSPAKSKLDNTTPQEHVHLRTNFKKAQMDSDKYKQIYDENQQLMRKMLKICDTAPSDAAVEFRPGMRLNTDQTPLLDSYVSVQSLTRGCAIDKGSMNGEFRQRQNDKIEAENRKLLHRLITKKSCYSARKWDDEYKQSISRFKHVHHDATVGYLSPKSRAATASISPYGVATTLPSLATSPRIDSATESVNDGGAPLSPCPPPAGNVEGGQRASTASGCTHRSSAFIRQASKSQVPTRKQTYRTKCVPVLLLEATTSMGVHFTVEELQVAMVTPSATQLGDQGFLLRAKKDENEGESVVPLKGLVDIAESLAPADGRPILAKLATIEAIPNSGNFPRVSQTLSESDLKLLLVKLVQCIRVSSVPGATDAAASLKLTVDHIPHLPRDLQPTKALLANCSIMDLFAQGTVPPRLVLRTKGATMHLCHTRVFQLRRLLAFHAFDVRTHNVVNFQFTEEDLLPHFHDTPLWTDIYRTLLRLAMKRIRI